MNNFPNGLGCVSCRAFLVQFFPDIYNIVFFVGQYSMSDERSIKMPEDRYRNDSDGSEVSGGPVRRDVHVVTHSDGSKHTTESVTTEFGSSRMSWDTDANGNSSNFHSNNN